jgi:hypothetical protein
MRPAVSIKALFGDGNAWLDQAVLAALRDRTLTDDEIFAPLARSEAISAARLRIHGAPDRRQSEAGRGYGTRAMIFS